jgi:hypothetical protein
MKKNIVLLAVLMVSVLAKAQIKNVKIPAPVTNQPRLKTTPQLQIDSTGMTKVVSVRPAQINGGLCPWVKTRGDNDFANNEVRVTVNIHFVYNQRYGDSVLKANIVLSGEENGGDRSTVSGEWQKVVYRAPAGWKIKNIRNDTTSLVTYFSFNTSVTEKFIDKGCHVRVYSPVNFGYRFTMPTLRDISIDVHSEKTDDFDTIESTCGCGFKINKIEFKYLYVTLEHL